MTNLKTKSLPPYSPSQFSSLEPRQFIQRENHHLPVARAATHNPEPARSAALLTACLILLQAIDGILTSMGVNRYGIAAEGNPLLRALMNEFGNVPTLGFVKCLAIIFILALSYYARRLPWIHNAMGAISCIYLFAAVLPWTYVLFIADLM